MGFFKVVKRINLLVQEDIYIYNSGPISPIHFYFLKINEASSIQGFLLKNPNTGKLYRFNITISLFDLLKTFTLNLKIEFQNAISFFLPLSLFHFNSFL